MQYNSSIRSRLLEPVLDLSNDRVEFRFAANELYKTNMRLMNLGFVGAAETTFNTKAGVLAMIEEVTLYDNNQILDSIRPAYNYLSFKSNLVSNRKQIAKKTILTGSLKNTATTNVGSLCNIIKPPSITEATDTTANLSLNLRDILPICRATDYLPTQIFKNLRLVIVFRATDSSLIATSTAALPGVTKQNPLLAVDMVNNPAIVSDVLKSFKGVGFNAIEYDSFVDAADATAAGKITTVTKRLFGLDNKYVNRVMIYRSPTRSADMVSGTALISAGRVRAIANVNPTYQISLNGSNMFVNPITETAEITAMCHDTWGQFSTSAISNKFGVSGYSSAALAGANRPAIEAYSLNELSSDAYFGCLVQNRIQSLEITVGRTQKTAPVSTIPSDSVYSQTQLVHIWAEVRKSVVIDKNLGYVIIYN